MEYENKVFLHLSGMSNSTSALKLQNALSALLCITIQVYKGKVSMQMDRRAGREPRWPQRGSKA